MTDLNIGFRPHYFEQLFQIESKNFWFISRNKMITWFIKKYIPNLNLFLEIGCGTGFVLNAISNTFPKASLTGTEFFSEGLTFASQRIPHAHFEQMDARTIKYENYYQAVGAFDVIEHIEEDTLVLSQICKALKKDGYLILTVPQHTWLWSEADTYACHVRRYEKIDLHDKIQKSGFKIIHSTSFVTLLLPLMYISRIIQKKSSVKNELDIHPFLNKLLLKILNFEFVLIKLGVNFSLGGSRIVIAQKS